MPVDTLHNLPAPRTALIGRQRELDATRALVLHADGRLLTMTGAGGSGKTSLAFQVARDLAADFPDGVRLVELAALADPALVPHMVASAVGARERPDVPILETLVTSLRARALLLVLDNCEHLVDGCARLVDLLLRQCPSLRVLATSREPLAVPGEIAWPVPGLAVPDPQRVPGLADLAEYSAVQLFTERARAAQPTFGLTADNALAIAQICARLGGIPLALELAAARVRVLPVERIEIRLADSFQLLAGGSRTAPTRQQTLRATLDWSHGLLSEPEQVLFRRLAVFSGGFDLDAAEAILAGETIAPGAVLEILARLVDKSLVLYEAGGAVERYRLLEPVRQYALERLAESPDAEPSRARHAEYFAEVAEAADAGVRGPRQASWLARLEREHDNLRAALTWSLATPDAAHTGLRIAAGLHWFWWIHSHFAEGQRWIDRTVAAADIAPTPARALALVAAGLHATLQGQYERVEAVLVAATAEASALGERWTAAWAAEMGAYSAEHRGDMALAEARAQDALEMSHALGDDWLIAFSHQRLGEAARGREEFTLAATRFRESLARMRRIGDTFSIANSLNALGQVAQASGDDHVAVELLRESLALARELGDKRRCAMCLEGLAGVGLHSGQPKAAVRLLGLAERLREMVGAQRESVDRTRFARHLQTARAALTETEFAQAWEYGRSSSLDGLSADPLEEGRAHLPTASSAAPLGALTQREHEVAVLVAHGLTNRQVAEELVIAEGTARIHVERILAKLGFSSRRQLTSWAIEQGLLTIHPR